jgi:hypothetical protein
MSARRRRRREARFDLMARGPTTFRQRDVTAAIKAAGAAGLLVARVEIDKSGKIIIVTGTQQEQTTRQCELDQELADFEAKHEDRAQGHPQGKI